MDINQAVDVVRESLTIMLLLSAPILLAALAIGLTISIFQAVTQIQEQNIDLCAKDHRDGGRRHPGHAMGRHSHCRICHADVQWSGVKTVKKHPEEQRIARQHGTIIAPSPRVAIGPVPVVWDFFLCANIR